MTASSDLAAESDPQNLFLAENMLPLNPCLTATIDVDDHMTENKAAIYWVFLSRLQRDVASCPKAHYKMGRY